MKEIDAAFEALEECKLAIKDARAALASLRSLTAKQGEQEPVMIYHGGCTIDCGEHGHHNMEMLKLIPAGTKLYAHPAPEAKQEPHGYLYDWTHSSALGKPDEHFTSFTKDKAHAENSVGNGNVRPVFLHPAPVNQQLLEALKQLVIATKHLNPCPGTLEMAEKAIKEAVGEV